jgi:hypothetical protein
MLRDVDSSKNINELSFGLEDKRTLQSNVKYAVKPSAVAKVTQSRNFNCTNVRNFQHTLDLTAQLLTVQLKLKVKLYVWGAPNTVCSSNRHGVVAARLTTEWPGSVRPL